MRTNGITKGILCSALLLGLLAPFPLRAAIECPATIPSGCECVTDITPGKVIPNQLCLVGKLGDPDHVIDFVATQVKLGGEGVEELLPKVDLDTIQSDGSFQIKVSLDEVGDYQFKINAHRYDSSTVPISYQDDPITVKVKKEGAPDFVPAGFGYLDASSKNQTTEVNDEDGNGVYEGGGAVSAKEVQVCVQPKSNASLSSASATNKVADDDVPGRVFTITSTVTVSPGSDASCKGGFNLSGIKTAHGTNEIALTLATQNGTQTLKLTLVVDLKGPHFTPTYTSNNKVVATSGQPTPMILMSEVGDQLMVKISAGETLSSAKNESDAFEGCDGPLCARLKGEKKWREVTPTEGGYQFTISQDELKFPLNFIELVGWDSVGNKSTETHSFAFGEVRHPFNSQKKLSLKDGLISNAVGGFLSEEYVTGALKDDLEHFFASEEFKLNLFPKLFTVEQPTSNEEIACGGDPAKPWEGSRIFEETGLVTFLHTPKKPQEGEIGYDDALKKYNETVKEINGMKVTIPMMQLLNENTVLVQLSIQDFKRKAEIFTVAFDENEANRPENVDKIPGKILGPNDPEFGQIVKDNTLGLTVLPVKFNIKDLDLYLKIQFLKDKDGKLYVDISPAPNAPDGALLKGIGDKGRLLKFDCDRFNSETLVHDTDGINGSALIEDIGKEKDNCEFLAVQNEKVAESNASEVFGPNKFNQSLDARFKTILAATVDCNLPFKVERQLAKFDTEAAMQTTMEVGDYCLSMDVFAPLGKADLSSKTWGLYFGSDAFLMPAGFEKKACSEVNEDVDYFEKEHNAYQYTDQNISEDLKKDKRFGAIYNPKDGFVDPGYEAELLNAPINLALAEDLINQVLFGSSLLLNDVMNNQGEGSKLLDLDQKMLYEDLGFSEPGCGNWKCLPKRLALQEIFEGLAKSIESQGHFQFYTGDAKDNMPLLMRTWINSYAPPTIRLVKATPAKNSSEMNLKLEVNLGSSLTEIFEEKLAAGDNHLGTGTGEIQDWCDDSEETPRASFMNPKKCQKGQILPIMSFRGTGKLTVVLHLSFKDNVLTLSGGLASKTELKTDESSGKKSLKTSLDKDLSYMDFVEVENNTGIANIAGHMKEAMGALLDNYTNGSNQQIFLRIPLQAPVLKGQGSFCSEHSLDEICTFCSKAENKDAIECQMAEMVDGLIDDLDIKKYGFAGGKIDEFSLSMTEDAFEIPSFLTIGLSPHLTYAKEGEFETVEGGLTVAPKFDPKKADQWKPEKEWEPEEREQYWEDKTPPWWKWW